MKKEMVTVTGIMVRDNRMDKSRAWALDILKNQPNVKITHRYFSSDEYIYGKEDGNVYDENGYLFEDWESDRFSGMRMRFGGVWEDGWDYK